MPAGISDHVHDTRHRLHRARVEAGHGSAGDRAANHRGDEHVRQADVDPEDTGAVDPGPRVHPGKRLSDDLEAADPERRLAGHLGAGGLVGQLPVGGPLPGRRVGHGSRRCDALRHRHAPSARGRAPEHLPRRGARQAQRLVLGLDARAPAGDLDVERWIVEGPVGRRRDHPHRLDADLELLGHDHREPCLDALPHLDLRADEGDAVRGDAQERARGERSCSLGGVGPGLARSPDLDQEPAADRCADLQELAARDGHRTTPAARRTAARMRG